MGMYSRPNMAALSGMIGRKIIDHLRNQTVETDDDIKASADACIERIKRQKEAERMCDFKSCVKAIRVWVDEKHLWLELNDGRILGVPRAWFPKIRNATIEQLGKYELIGDGIGIHWVDLDEDINVPNLLRKEKYKETSYE